MARDRHPRMPNIIEVHDSDIDGETDDETDDEDLSTVADSTRETSDIDENTDEGEADGDTVDAFEGVVYLLWSNNNTAQTHSQAAEDISKLLGTEDDHGDLGQKMIDMLIQHHRFIAAQEKTLSLWIPRLKDDLQYDDTVPPYVDRWIADITEELSKLKGWKITETFKEKMEEFEKRGRYQVADLQGAPRKKRKISEN